MAGALTLTWSDNFIEAVARPAAGFLWPCGQVPPFRKALSVDEICPMFSSRTLPPPPNGSGGLGLGP